MVAQYLANFDKTTNQKLNIKGNLMQALGAGMNFSTEVGEHNMTTDELYTTYGNLLQLIGNSMQALSGGIQLKGGDAQSMNTAGSWIQAIGAVLSAVGQS
ncbi:DUF6944 family repetitive protein [Sediminibacillus massiliensis]|uniref:DUF6944 family repetitive protein n=1 Tax=Sediminibacillus massiliensis TaxID=1926277 RepID=UPI003CCB9493